MAEPQNIPGINVRAGDRTPNGTEILAVTHDDDGYTTYLERDPDGKTATFRIRSTHKRTVLR